VVSYADYEPVVDPAPGFSLVVKPSYYDYTIGLDDSSPAVVDSLSNGNYRVKGTSTGDSIFGMLSKSATSVSDYLMQFHSGDKLQYSFSFVTPVESYLPKFLSLVVFFYKSDGSLVSFNSYYKKTDLTPNTQYTGAVFIEPGANVTGLQFVWQFSGDYSDEGKSNVLPALYFRDGYLSPFGDTLERMRTEKNQQEIIGSDADEESASGLKGILLWIKSIPEKLGELLKKLFIPTEDQVTNFKDDTEELLQSRLGLVWESGQLIYSSAIHFYLFKPDKESSLTFPALKVNMSDQGVFSEGSKKTGTNFVMWDKQTVKFDFLKDKPYKQLYDLYKVVVCGMLVCIVINYAYRKGEKILSGSEG